jgi:hypothetical protein
MTRLPRPPGRQVKAIRWGPKAPSGSSRQSGVVPQVAAKDDIQRLNAPAALPDHRPELVGDVVSPATVKLTKKAILKSRSRCRTPGRYRLTVTLHDASGVAYDADSQTIPSLIVRGPANTTATSRSRPRPTSVARMAPGPGPNPRIARRGTADRRPPTAGHVRRRRR